MRSPGMGGIVLEEMAVEGFLRFSDAPNDRVVDACHSICHIQWGIKSPRLLKTCFYLVGILICGPTRIHAVHIDTIACIICRRGARHHIQSGLRHIRMGMVCSLALPIELSLHGGDIDNKS